MFTHHSYSNLGVDVLSRDPLMRVLYFFSPFVVLIFLPSPRLCPRGPNSWFSNTPYGVEDFLAELFYSLSSNVMVVGLRCKHNTKLDPAFFPAQLSAEWNR